MVIDAGSCAEGTQMAVLKDLLHYFATTIIIHLVFSIGLYHI